MCEQILGQCVDETGLAVDWAIIYKLPKHSEHHHLNTVLPQTGDDYIKEGLGYFYMTSKSSENSDGGWIKSELSVKDVNSLPGKILGPLYNEEERNSNLFYMLYNDEHPDGHTRFNLGHTKGKSGEISELRYIPFRSRRLLIHNSDKQKTFHYKLYKIQI